MTPEEEAKAALEWRFIARETRLISEREHDRKDRIEQEARTAYNNQPLTKEFTSPGMSSQQPLEHFLKVKASEIAARDRKELFGLVGEYLDEREALRDTVRMPGGQNLSGAELAKEVIDAVARKSPDRDPNVARLDPRPEFNLQAERSKDPEWLVIEGQADRAREARLADRARAERPPFEETAREFNMQGTRTRTPEQEAIYQETLKHMREREERLRLERARERELGRQK